MQDDEKIWALEEQFWTGHKAFHEKTVTEDSIMCFGDPLGVLKGGAAMKALDEAPDWTGVEMRDRVSARPQEDVAIAGYLAHGNAGNGVIHRVYCSSTWVRSGDGWNLVQHQQTPA